MNGIEYVINHFDNDSRIKIWLHGDAMLLHIGIEEIGYNTVDLDIEQVSALIKILSKLKEQMVGNE